MRKIVMPKGWKMIPCPNDCQQRMNRDDCPNCKGSGLMWISPKGRIADYPGGPFRGQLSRMKND